MELFDLLMSRRSGGGGGDCQEKICGFENVEDVLPETELVPNMSMGAYPITSILSMPVAGQMCRVKCRGVEYLCQVNPLMEDVGAGEPVELGVQIGSTGVLSGGAGTGEPFFIMLVYPEYQNAVGGFAGIARFNPPDGTDSQYQPENETVSIVKMDVRKIPDVFLPQSKAELVILTADAQTSSGGVYDFTCSLDNIDSYAFNEMLTDTRKTVRIRLNGGLEAPSDFEFRGYDDTGSPIFKAFDCEASDSEYVIIREYKINFNGGIHGVGDINVVRLEHLDT